MQLCAFPDSAQKRTGNNYILSAAQPLHKIGLQSLKAKVSQVFNNLGACFPEIQAKTTQNVFRNIEHLYIVTTSREPRISDDRGPSKPPRSTLVPGTRFPHELGPIYHLNTKSSFQSAQQPLTSIRPRFAKGLCTLIHCTGQL